MWLASMLSEAAVFLRQWPCFKDAVILNPPADAASPSVALIDGAAIVRQLRVAITDLTAVFLSADGSRVDYQV
jgi:hypothetical protein